MSVPMPPEQMTYEGVSYVPLSELAASRREVAALKLAIVAFVAKYDALEPALNNAFLMEKVHGRPYTGDNWSAEIAELRRLAALAEGTTAGERTL